MWWYIGMTAVALAIGALAAVIGARDASFES